MGLGPTLLQSLTSLLCLCSLPGCSGLGWGSKFLDTHQTKNHKVPGEPSGEEVTASGSGATLIMWT
jgi:hypothetical protein